MPDSNPTSIGVEWSVEAPLHTGEGESGRVAPPDDDLIFASSPLWKRVLHSDSLTRVIALVVFFAAWQYAGYRVNRVLFASPQATWDAFRSQLSDGSLIQAWKESLVVLFAGLFVAAALGVTLGILLGRMRLLNQLLQPPLTAIFMTPKIALLPLISLWLGYRTAPKIVVVVLFGFFQIYYTFLAGVRTIDAEYVEVSRAYGISRFRLIGQVVVPASLPYLLTSLRLGLLHGMVGVVLGGFFLETVGIGGLIGDYASSFRIAYVFSTLLTVALVGVAINIGLQVLERVLVPWKSEDFA